MNQTVEERAAGTVMQKVSALLCRVFAKIKEKGAFLAGQRMFALSMISVSFVLCCFLNNYDSLWWDEICSLMATNMPFEDMFSFLTTKDAHPPLYYILLKGWRGIFGSSVLAARLFSWFPLALLAFFGGQKVNKLYGRRVANWFVLLVLFLPASFIFQRMIRMYALCFCFIGLQFVYMLSFLKDGKKSDLWKSVLFSLIAAYAHYYAMLAAGIVYACMVVSALFSSDRKKLILTMLPAGVVVVIGIIPNLICMYHQFLLLTSTNLYKQMVSFSAWDMLLQGFRSNTVDDAERVSELNLSLFALSQKEMLSCGWIFMLFFLYDRKNKPVFIKKTIYVALGVIASFCLILTTVSAFYRPVFLPRQAFLIYVPVSLIFVLSFLQDRKYELLFGILFSLTVCFNIKNDLALKNDRTLADLRQVMSETLKPDDMVVAFSFADRVFLQYYFPENELRMFPGCLPADELFLKEPLEKLHYYEYRMRGGTKRVFGLSYFNLYPTIFTKLDSYSRKEYKFFEYIDY